MRRSSIDTLLARPSVGLALACLLLAAPLSAVTLVELSDGFLLQQSDLVVSGRVLHLSAEGTRHTRVGIEIDRVLSGAVGASGDEPSVASLLNVRLPGIQADLLRPDVAGQLVVPGLPHFRRGDEVLVFLGPPHADGVRPLQQLTLGAFFRRPTSQVDAAVRQLASGVRLLEDATRPKPADDTDPIAVQPLVRRLRGWDAFLSWLESRSAELVKSETAGADGPATAFAGADDYRLGEDAVLLESADDAYTFLGGSPVRWFVFDEGESVRVRAHQSGLANTTHDVFSALQIATRAWNNDAGSQIDLRYAGTTSSTTGLTGSDGTTAVLWNDPNNEVSGSYVCGQGGVLGLGGGFTLGTGTFENGSAIRLVEGDIVINDGAGCFFDGANGLDGQEILAHELGHTLGLGHTNTQPARSLMRSSAHGDGRGAQLGPDDRNGIRFLYPTAAGEGPGEIGVAQSQVSVGEGNTVQIGVNRAGGSAGPVSVRFTLEAVDAEPGLDFVVSSGTLAWADGEAGVRDVPITILDDVLVEGPETLRLVLSQPTGATLGSTTTTITIVDDDQPPPAGTVRFSDRRTDATERDGTIVVRIERNGTTTGAATVGVRIRGGTARRNLDYSFVDTQVSWAAGDGSQRQVSVELLVDDRIEPVETIVLELHDPTGGVAIGSFDRHVIDLAEAIAPGPCVASATTLCLVGGRFRVDSEWETATGDSGDGGAVRLTDDTGYFWFFSEDNVEVTLKVLDACELVDRFWVFAGGLTSIEVRIRVVDTLRDATRVFISPQGAPFAPVQDTSAFTTCP